MTLSVMVYDKAYNRKGPIGAPTSLAATLTHNSGCIATLEVEDDHPRAQHLLTEGARVIIEDTGVFISGPAFFVGASMTSSALTFQVVDWFALLRWVQGWPIPSAALNAQTVPYWTASGPAESVLKAAVTANMTNRLGLPVVCAPDLGRGAHIDVSLRFHPLFDRLFPAVDQAGLGVTFKQTGAQIVCDVYVPPVDTRPLTAESGVIQDWTYSATPPSATRVVIGDQGEGAARNFTAITNTSVETRFMLKQEVFADARDTDVADVVAARGSEKLNEGLPSYGYSVTLSDSGAFAFGKGLHLGQKVTLNLGGTPVTDVLRQVSFVLDADGKRTTPIPTIGERRDDTNWVVARRLATQARRLMALETGR